MITSTQKEIYLQSARNNHAWYVRQALIKLDAFLKDPSIENLENDLDECRHFLVHAIEGLPNE